MSFLPKEAWIFIAIDDYNTQFFIDSNTIEGSFDDINVTVVYVPDNRGNVFSRFQNLLKEEKKDFTVLRYIEQSWGLDLSQDKYAIYDSIYKSEDGSTLHSVSYPAKSIEWKRFSDWKVAEKVALIVSNKLDKEVKLKKTPSKSATKEVVGVDKGKPQEKEVYIKIPPKPARPAWVVKKDLEAQYVQLYQMMGFTCSEAQDIFEGFFEKAKEQALKEGTLELPENFGDMMLEMEHKDEGLKKRLSMKRGEGVRDEDIRWWGNMHELERGMMLQNDSWGRVAYFKYCIENYGLTDEEAVESVRKSHPMFGDPEDTSHTTGDDRPLPYELKDRINIFIEKMAKSSPADLEKYKKEVQGSSSYNAFVRKQIRNGKI